ncbi:MAG: flagellar biosynthetic protein FliO [Chloroflexota bacterium]
MHRITGSYQPRSLLTAFTVGFVSLVVALWLVSLRAESVTAEQQLPSPPPAAESPAPRLDALEGPGVGLDLLLKLGAVLGLAYVSLALLKRYTYGGSGMQRGNALKVLESTTLAPNRTVYLVRAGDRHVLLGVTPTQITALSEWPASDLPESAIVPRPFQEHLASLPK